jgi:hypothetical protein
MQESAATPPPPEQPEQRLPETVTDFMSEADLAEFYELKAKISNDLDQEEESSVEPQGPSSELPEDSGTEEESDTEPLYPAPEDDADMDDELSAVLKELERYETSTAPQEESAVTEPDVKGTTEEIEEFVPHVDEMGPENNSIISDPFMLDQMLNPAPPPQKKKSGGWLWAIGILLLLTASLAQLGWFERERLIKYPEGRMLLETACKYAGCELPILRAPEKIQVVNRSITVHPRIENALLIQLTIANKANFPQPHPQLQIGLFSSDERLVMQRRFQPSEYLAEGTEPGMLTPGKAMYVELAIEDPGDDVTGFKLDFF